jgi:two-component system chemotaxis sensor kinase CheA
MDRIREKVIANGLATEAELEEMSDQQIQQFIFRPGFSTAQQVTSVSGRGVGMDVVRTNIEKIGGTIELKSVEHQGSTFIIKIPLTLAIVSALIIECASERFAIPQISVVELVRASKNSEHTIEQIEGTPVLRLRNRLLPLVPLRELMKLEAEATPSDNDETFVVVTQVGNYTFGIIVDRVFDTEEIVVKPVAPVLRNIPMFSGNTILGDGSVIMILDPNGIAAQTGEISVADQAAVEAGAVQSLEDEERVTLLLFRAGDQTPKAVPLALVARLEEIDLEKIEYSEGKPLVQYRGKLMPLIPVSEGIELGESGRQPILVFSDQARSMGLLVDDIVDIVEDRLSMELSAQRPGILGSAIIAGQATDVIDTGYYLTQAFNDWFGLAGGDGSAANDAGDGTKRRVLLVDDSPFFRNLLSPMLSVAGYSVTSVDCADKALEMCESGRDFDVIVSDIEMPGMNGFEFANTVRSGSRWANTPMVALSAHATSEDFDRGREAGFTDYVAKFDREGLLEALNHTCATDGVA